MLPGKAPRSPFDPASWRSDRLEHKDDSSANYNGRKSTTPVDTTGGWASTAPATGQGKANNAVSSLAQSQGRERERERDHHGRSPHERSSSRTRPSRWEPMQPPAQVQNAELPAERQRLELRRRAMDAAIPAASSSAHGTPCDYSAEDERALAASVTCVRVRRSQPLR